MSRVTLDEILNKAYRLAYFLHQDKATAKQITLAAVLKLDVAMAVQSKRLYYVPMGRFLRGESRRVGGVRSKAIFSDLHLLQRLIYSESEPYERRKESAAFGETQASQFRGRPLDDEDLLVYFVKHLVRITLKRNAFYATLGISRLLHNYSTVEAMDIYNAVIGEPERVKDDYYYRSRKGVLMQEMKQRFGHLLRVCRRQRGEERFETQPCSSEHRSLVTECLRLFTPWNTRCPVPEEFDPLKTVIAHRTDGGRADESQAEIGRIHSVLHPDCFERLIAGLGHDPPGRRLEVPRFYYQQADEPPFPRQQRAAPNMNLNAEELADIHNALAQQARRRQISPAALMRIVVDGVERATLNPVRASGVNFNAEEGAEIIEVRTSDSNGDLLLATHLLVARQETQDARPHTFSIRLEGGQELFLSIRRREYAATGAAEWLVDLSYRETNLRRALRLFLLRLGLLRDAPNSRSRAGRRSPGLVLACGTVLVCALAYLVYLGLRTSPPQAQMQTRSELASALSVLSALAQDGGADGGGAVVSKDENRAPRILPTERRGTEAAAKSRRPVRQAPSREQAGAKGAAVASAALEGLETRAGAAPAGAEEELELTRSGDSRMKGVMLGEVRRIYLELSGDGPLDELRRRLSAELSAGGLVTATNTDEADAALKVSVKLAQVAAEVSTTAGHDGIEMRVEVSARLVNALGKVLWPRAVAGQSRRYSGVVAQLAPVVVKDLLADIRSAQTRR